MITQANAIRKAETVFGELLVFTKQASLSENRRIDEVERSLFCPA